MCPRSFTAAVANLKRAALLILVFTIGCARWTLAQDSNSRPFSRYEVFGGYLAAGQTAYSDLQFGNGVSLQSGFSTTHGVEVSFAYNFNRILGIKGDFSLQPHTENFTAGICMQAGCSPVLQRASANPRLYNFLVGPEFKLRNHTLFTPFAHGLTGIAHSTATFSTAGPAATLSLENSETGFSVAIGGGVDIRLSKRFSVRTGVDFNPAWVGRDDTGARTVLKNVRISAGILLH